MAPLCHGRAIDAIVHECARIPGTYAGQAPYSIISLYISDSWLKGPIHLDAYSWERNAGKSKTKAIPALLIKYISTPLSAVALVPEDPTYNLDRFLADQNLPPGFGQALSKAEAEAHMLTRLHDFDAQFSASNNLRDAL
ncbi:hypothetical protein V8C37DRAFT_376771 [Trichoderma ceciliae]